MISIGSFDGVHKGHQAIISRINDISREKNLRSLVASFEPHPREVLSDEMPPLLSPTEEKIILLKNSAIKAFATLPFTREMAFMEPEAFVEDILVAYLNIRAIVVGYDHHFGRNRRGNVDLLRSMGKDLDYAVHECDQVAVSGQTVSSSLIREALQNGQVDLAASFLGRMYSLAGTVVGGAKRGKTIGFPTANISVASDRKLIPAGGVYAVWVKVPGYDVKKKGMMNIGTRPTFEGNGRIHIEVNILDFDGSIYDRELRVEFVRRIRNEQKFGSVDELVQQLNADRARCNRLLR